MRELALFAGAGGGILGGHLLGWRTRCAVEFDPYARAVLLARQRDGCLPRFPIWDDVRTFDGKPWRGSIDIVTGGFPCQDISAAGKGAGITGERSGLWKHMARIVGEVRPCYVWVENSPLLVGRGLAVVLGDLSQMGYDARWGIVGADDAIWSHCAPCVDHERARLWILANANTDRLRKLQPKGCISDKRGRIGDGCSQGSNPNSLHAEGQQSGMSDTKGRPEPRERPPRSQRHGVGWWATEPNVGGMAHGLAAPLDIHGANAAGNVARVGVRIPKRADRLRCIGNGQVPAALVLAWRILNDL